jgi:hypothetical protein
MARRGRFRDKSPTEVRSYRINWAAPLDTDTITGTPVWTISGPDSSLTKDSQSNTTTTTDVILSGGTLGSTYQVKCQVATLAGLTLERTDLLKVSVR